MASPASSRPAPRTGVGSPREGISVAATASPGVPSLHLTKHPLTQALVCASPGRQVQCRKCTALDKVPREGVGHEDVVLGHGGDACIVADDARQGDLGQSLLLSLAEYTLVLPPKPA